MIAEAVEHRQAAIDQTAPEISKMVLAAMPELIAHPGPPGAPGPYYTDADLNRAICATAEEAMLLHDAVRLSGANLVLEIGSYVGWTAVHMAYATHGKVLCVDDLTESSSHTLQMRRWHYNTARANVAGKTELIVGTSPECLEALTSPVDFAFVDGEHLHGQPLRDVMGLMPYMQPGGIIAMHDTWMADVQVACDWLTQCGWLATVFNTPGRLALFYKHTPAWLAVLTEGAQ